jgi:hypothetical protein
LEQVSAFIGIRTLMGMGTGFGMAGSMGSLNPTNGGCGCITNTNAFLTNISAALISGSNMTFSFTIEGGTSGMAYNVYSTTNLWMTNIADAVWTLLGQGTNCGTYCVTNQPMNRTFYILGSNQPVYTKDNVFVVYAQPITSTGNLGTCPGPYTGYINYLPTNGAWGFTPLTNTTVFTASDTTRTNTRVEYVGAYGDEGCAQTTVTIPNPPASPAYRFSIYFTNNVPSTNFPITLSGFSP